MFSKTLKILRIAAMLVFVCSFFLPAVADSHNGQSDLRGWPCAYLTLGFLADALSNLFKATRPGEWSELMIGTTGLINPLLLGYLVVRNAAWKRGLAFAIAVLGCIAVPVALRFLHFRAIWGCYLWLGAILLLLLPEVLHPKQIEIRPEPAQEALSVQD